LSSVFLVVVVKNVVRRKQKNPHQLGGEGQLPAT
jgi:hypothetical protein